MAVKRPVGVCTFVGRDVRDLATVIRQEAETAVAEVGAYLDFDFSPAHLTFETFIDALHDSDGAWSMLHIVSHADDEGRMPVTDVWDSLTLEPEALTRALKDSSVRIALVGTCHGEVIARALVDAGAVDVAIGIDLDESLTYSMARAFSRGFYRALARGASIERAFADGQRLAAGRDGTDVDRLKLIVRDDASAKMAVFAPPTFYVVGEPSSAHADAVEKLRAAVAPHRLFHLSDVAFGDERAETLASRLEQASVIMVVFEGERVQDAEVLEQVASAVQERQHRRARVFPLYLSGTRPSRHVPYGLRRLQPAFLEEARYKGDYQKLGADLVKLLG